MQRLLVLQNDKSYSINFGYALDSIAFKRLMIEQYKGEPLVCQFQEYNLQRPELPLSTIRVDDYFRFYKPVPYEEPNAV